MRKSEELYEKISSIRTVAQREIVRLIKSAGKIELKFDDAIQVAYFDSSLNGEGWITEEIESIVINEWGAITRIWTPYGYEILADDIQIGEWWYILDCVEMQLENMD